MNNIINYIIQNHLSIIAIIVDIIAIMVQVYCYRHIFDSKAHFIKRFNVDDDKSLAEWMNFVQDNLYKTSNQEMIFYIKKYCNLNEFGKNTLIALTNVMYNIEFSSYKDKDKKEEEQ